MLNEQDWGIIALAVVAAYVISVMLRVYRMKPALEHRVYLWGSVWFFLSLVSRVVVKVPFWPDLIDPNYVTDTFIMLAMSHLLVGLAVVVRESKPIVTRFPLALAFTPFLLIPAHLLVSHTFVLKQILYAIYEFGAATIGLLIYGLMAASDRRYLNVLYGIILHIASFSLQWVPIPVPWDVWAHWALVSTALLVTTRSYKSIIKQSIPD